MLACVILTARPVGAGDLIPRHLTDPEKAGIAASSFALLGIGGLLKHHTADEGNCGDYHAPGIDRLFRRLIHGDNGAKSNFLDNNWGSAATPTVALIGIGLMDINRAEFSHDLPLFISGVIATKGLTDITKHLVRRPRPCCVNGDCPETGDQGDPVHGHSFFSGHASSVFFTSTFFNRRFRHHMRQNWTGDEYRVGRVLSPIVSFSWATFVGLSRIQADRHYFTDVAAGALVGAVMGELFFRLAYENQAANENSNGTTPLFLIRIPIN